MDSPIKKDTTPNEVYVQRYKNFIRLVAEYKSGGTISSNAANTASTPPVKLPGNRGERCTRKPSHRIS